MQEIKWSDAQAVTLVQTLYRSSLLLPFFGSGFSKGMRTKSGRIPDAAQLVKHITDIASAANGISDSEKKQIEGISNLKTAFSLLSRDEYISGAKARGLLGNIFSETQIADADKKALLNLDWPHIFSFNIDDGIEKATRRFRVLHPNKPVSREFIAANNCLFKVHGDIAEYIQYEKPNVIFTWREYAHSIANNAAMLSYMEERAKEAAFLFIGCSLDAEMDMLYLSRSTPFKKSIFLKKGNLTLPEKLALPDYGIETAIIFDSYDQICSWLVASLKSIKRSSPFKSISFDESLLPRKEALEIIARGGPISKTNGKIRTARNSKTFADRSIVEVASNLLRVKDCLLITGRRFSGKTMFLFQLMWSLKEFNQRFYASNDKFDIDLKKQIPDLENHLYVFDSNYLNSQSLEEVFRKTQRAGSKIVFCASSGDAELFRNQLESKGVDFLEMKLDSSLDKSETDSFNNVLSQSGLPLYLQPETLLTQAYRYHDEFQAQLGSSSLFGKTFDTITYSVILMVATFGKVESAQIECFNRHFAAAEFVSSNDRLFELETSVGGGYVITCNSSAWLLKTVGDFIKNDPSASGVIADVIKKLSAGGFSLASESLIRFDKLNELSGRGGALQFIRDVYSKIEPAYHDDLHYWLQRAKCELISATSISGLKDGMRYASKVRLDTATLKNSTYYSATLVAAQLNARAYRKVPEERYMLEFLDRCLESVRNYGNNKRHIDNMLSAKHDDSKFTLGHMKSSTLIKLLPRKKDIQELTNFFETAVVQKNSKKGRRLWHRN